jgi:hypothetical protein
VTGPNRPGSIEASMVCIASQLERHVAHVVGIADRDDAGRDHARIVAARVQQHAASVQIAQAASGKDAADHPAAGHTPPNPGHFTLQADWFADRRGLCPTSRVRCIRRARIRARKAAPIGFLPGSHPSSRAKPPRISCNPIGGIESGSITRRWA